MRTLALFLILLNTGFFAWQLELLPWLLWQPDQFARTSWSHQLSDLPVLTLLGERNSENFVKTTMVATKLPQTNLAKTAVPTSTNTAANQTTSVTNLASLAPKKKPGMTAKVPKVLKTAKENHTKAALVSKLQQAAGLPITPKIHTKNKDKVQQSLIPPPTFSCFQTGLHNRSKISKIAKRLENKKDVIFKVQNYQKPISTWVYLPSFKNRQKARRVQQRLNQFGISDHAIVTKGRFNNAISLGLYRKPFNVKIRIQELNAMGYQNVKIQKRYKNDTSYRLNVKMLAGRNELLDILQKTFKGLRLKPVNCKAIALPQ